MESLPFKPPMTGQEAQALVAEMIRVTSKKARVRIMQLALGPVGNLSEEAREVYRGQLALDLAQ